MEWYYAVGGQQKGPVAEDELQRLAGQGIVNAETLVWREGMPGWQPYGNPGSVAMPPPVTVDNAPRGGVLCAGCNQVFPGGEVISLGDGLYCAACKPIALQRLKEGGSATSAVEEIRKEYLKHEASVKSIGLLYYLGGACLGLVGIVGLASGLGGTGGGEVLVAVGLSAFFLILGFGQIWVGAGLRRLKRWARVPTGILSGLGLLGFPLGTIINGYILYLVFSKKGAMVFSDEYRAVIEQTPHIKYRTSVLIWILVGLVLLLVGLALLGAILGTSR